MPTWVNFAPSMLARWAGLSIRTRCGVVGGVRLGDVLARDRHDDAGAFQPVLDPARRRRDVTEEVRGDHVLGVRDRDRTQLGIDGERRQPAPRGGLRSAARACALPPAAGNGGPDAVAMAVAAPRRTRRRRRRSARWRAPRGRWRRRSSPPPGRRRARAAATRRRPGVPESGVSSILPSGGSGRRARGRSAPPPRRAAVQTVAGPEAARERVQGHLHPSEDHRRDAARRHVHAVTSDRAGCSRCPPAPGARRRGAAVQPERRPGRDQAREAFARSATSRHAAPARVQALSPRARRPRRPARRSGSPSSPRACSASRICFASSAARGPPTTPPARTAVRYCGAPWSASGRALAGGRRRAGGGEPIAGVQALAASAPTTDDQRPIPLSLPASGAPAVRETESASKARPL